MEQKHSKRISLNYRDISLDRVYSVLYVYFSIYDDYIFEILRYPNFYELVFHGRRVREEGL